MALVVGTGLEEKEQRLPCHAIRWFAQGVVDRGEHLEVVGRCRWRREELRLRLHRGVLLEHGICFDHHRVSLPGYRFAGEVLLCIGFRIGLGR